MEDYENLTVVHDDNVATITLDDVSGRNALTLKTANELISVATRLGEDPKTRCIILTHEGDFFGSGADLSQLSGDASDAPHLRELAGRAHDAIIQFHRSETPVVGGVNGTAAGIGFSLALMPDLVVLSDDATLKFAYPGIGLTGDGGATFFLPRLVGLRAAKEIVLQDKVIDSNEAVDLGLANEAVPSEKLNDRLETISAKLASGPTRALGTTIRLLTDSYDRSLEGHLSIEADEIARASQTEDYERGFKAFFDKDEPDFVGQ